MLQRLAISALALILASCAAMPASAAAPSRSDGKCPDRNQPKDADYVRERFQFYEDMSYRGSGRLDGDKPQGGLKSSRDEFPRRRVGGGASGDGPSIPPARRGWVEGRQGLVAASDRDQFPTDRRGSGGPAPRAPKA